MVFCGPVQILFCIFSVDHETFVSCFFLSYHDLVDARGPMSANDTEAASGVCRHPCVGGDQCKQGIDIGCSSENRAGALQCFALLTLVK